MSAALAVVCLALVVAIVLIERAHTKLVYDLEERQAHERSELMTRIQRPELVPFPRRSGPPLEAPATDAEELASVGTVAPLAEDQ